MRLAVTITPDKTEPDSTWHLTQGLDTIGTVTHHDWPADSRSAATPYELQTPSHNTGAPAPRVAFATLGEAASAADELAEQLARTSTAEPVEVHRETYRDIEFVITRHPATAGDRSRSFARYQLLHGGRHVQCPKGDPETIVKKARGWIDTHHADQELLPTLTALIDARPNDRDLVDLDGTPHNGEKAYVWAMGRWRRGLVTKVARTRATVAYTTASSRGAVYRKAAKFADLYAA